MSEGQNPSPSYWSTVPYSVLSSRTLSDKTKLVYGVIASLTQAKDEDGAILGYCYASNAYLADIMGCGERTITRSVAELVEAGELIVRHVGTNKAACKHQRRIYTLETYVRSLVKSGEVASFDYAGLDKNGEALINRIDNKRNDNKPPIIPQGNNAADRFEAFWVYYRDTVCADDHSRAGNKAAAQKAWDKLAPGKDLADKLAVYLAAQLRTEMWQRGYGIPYASTLLNRIRRGEVDLTPAETPRQPPASCAQTEQPRQEAWGWQT